METPSPEAAERETRIRRFSALHSPMLQEHVSLSLWMAPLRSTMKSVVWSLLRPSSVLVGPVLVEDRGSGRCSSWPKLLPMYALYIASTVPWSVTNRHARSGSHIPPATTMPYV